MDTLIAVLSSLSVVAVSAAWLLVFRLKSKKHHIEIKERFPELDEEISKKLPDLLQLPDLRKTLPENLEKEIIERLKSKGRLNLHYDRNMVQGKVFRIEATIFKDPSNALKQAFTESYELKTAPVMKVELTGKNFEIIPVGKNEQQFILGDSPTSWRWDVKPLKHGKQVLEVTASVCFVIDKYGPTYRNLDTLKEEIKVKVNVPLAVKNGIIENWKWAVATISALAGLILTYLKYTGFFGKE